MEKKMKISVEIDGVIYTPVFNFNTFIAFEQRHGLTIVDFSKMNNPTFKQLIDLAFLGIQEFSRINKINLPFDVLYLGTLSSETINRLIESIGVNMMPISKPSIN